MTRSAPLTLDLVQLTNGVRGPDGLPALAVVLERRPNGSLLADLLGVWGALHENAAREVLAGEWEEVERREVVAKFPNEELVEA